MTFKQLEYFLAFASCLNYTNAAQICFTTQPNLGRQIEKLEKELGLKLTLRVNGKNTLTDAGKLLEERGTQLMGYYNEMMSELLAHGSKPEIIFGYTTKHALMDALRKYVGDEFCGYHIKWVHGTGQVLLDAGLLDMCFTFSSFSPEHENYIKLDDADIYALVPRALFSVRSYLEPADFEGQIVMLPAGNLRELCQDFFQKHDVHPNIQEFPSIIFDKSIYLEQLEKTGSIGFAPIDDYQMYEDSFFLTKVNGMTQTIPIGIQWSGKKDHDCRWIAEKIAAYAQKVLKTFPTELV